MGRPKGSRDRGYRFRFEPLECRRLLSFDPTGYEQASLEHLNRMRMNPQEELDVLFSSLDPVLVARDPSVQFTIDLFDVSAADLVSQYSTLQPLPPLAWNGALHDAAAEHNRLMIAADKQSHQLPNEPNLGQRLAQAGYDPTAAGENVYAYAKTVLFGHAGFAVDWKPGAPGIQNPPTHRNNIMSAAYREVGIDVAEEYNTKTAVGPLVITQNFGNRSDFSPQLLGVVWNDLFANGIYDPGEGISRVTIRAEGTQGVYVTTTLTAGGYQMPLPSGTYRVTATGAGIPGMLVANNVVMGNENVKVDFELHSASAPLPVANDDSATVDERGYVALDILANDADAGAGLVPSSVRILDRPKHGTAVVNVFTGSIYYQPSLNHVGSDSLTYQVRSADGVMSNPATVRLQTQYRVGDFDHDGRVRASDIDALFAQLDSPNSQTRFDLTGDRRITQRDVNYLIETVIGTRMGDANLDRQVNLMDFYIWSVHRFSTDSPSWSRGDFNGDRTNDAADFNIWLSNAGAPLTAMPSAQVAGPDAAHLDERSSQELAKTVEVPGRELGHLAANVERRRHRQVSIVPGSRRLAVGTRGDEDQESAGLQGLGNEDARPRGVLVEPEVRDLPL